MFLIFQPFRQTSACSDTNIHYNHKMRHLDVQDDLHIHRGNLGSDQNDKNG